MMLCKGHPCWPVRLQFLQPPPEGGHSKLGSSSRPVAASAVQPSWEERRVCRRRERTPNRWRGRRAQLPRSPPFDHCYTTLYTLASVPPVPIFIRETEWKQKPRERSDSRRPGTGVRCPLPQHPMMETWSLESATGWTRQTRVNCSALNEVYPSKMYISLQWHSFPSDVTAVTRKSRLIFAN